MLDKTYANNTKVHDTLKLLCDLTTDLRSALYLVGRGNGGTQWGNTFQQGQSYLELTSSSVIHREDQWIRQENKGANTVAMAANK